MNPISIILVVLALVVGVAAGYFFHRYQRERTLKGQRGALKIRGYTFWKAHFRLRLRNSVHRLAERGARRKIE